MNTYELTIVLSGKATASTKKSVTVKIKDLLKQHKGKIVKTEEWGEIPFASKIKKEASGNFICFEIELEPASVKHVDDKLRLDEDVIRHLLVKVNAK